MIPAAVTAAATVVAVCATARLIAEVRRVRPVALPSAAWVRTPVVAALIDRRRARRADRALPDVIEAVARGLRGGANLASAIAAAAPREPELLTVEWTRLAAAVGDVGVVAATERWRSTRSSPVVDLVASALATAAEAGGPQARAIDAVALTLRQRLAVAAELHALTAQARASAAVLAVAPLGFVVVAAGLQPNYLSFLLGTPLGWACLIAGAGLLAAGFVWMARITRVAA